MKPDGEWMHKVFNLKRKVQSTQIHAEDEGVEAMNAIAFWVSRASVAAF